MSESYYSKDTSTYMADLKKEIPKLMEKFSEFNDLSFEDGAVSKKMKELIAVACAHITRCPYCIDGHVKRALKEGATPKEISEAIFVAVAMNAGASIAHSRIAMETVHRLHVHD